MSARKAMRVCALVTVMMFCLAGAAFAEAPHGMAGFVLGKNVKEYTKKIDVASTDRVWGREYLNRVDINPLPGFRSGYLMYGNCADPGRIVRLKLSYEDESEKLFNTLLTELKKRYGANPLWRGNAFGTLKTWKWGLKDAEGNKVSLILQHYKGDGDTYTPGNSIRLAVSTWVEEEAACYRKKPNAGKVERPSFSEEEKRLGLNWFLPY